MKSLSLIAAVQDVDAINAALETLGRGPGCLSVALSPSGAEPVTHRGCHTYDDELIEIVGGMDGLHVSAVDDTASVANFKALASGLGLQVVAPEPEA